MLKEGGTLFLDIAYILGSVFMLLFGAVALLKPNKFSSYYNRKSDKTRLKTSGHLEKQLFLANVRLGGAALFLIGFLLTLFFITNL